jgi:hypothetical protein
MAAVAAALGLVYGVYNLGYRAGQSKGMLALVTAQRDAGTKQLELWQQVRQKSAEIARVTDEYTNKVRVGALEADRLIADYKRGALRLRNSCKAADGLPDANHTVRSDERKAGGLQGEDVEDLIRLAARADDTAKQLAACQRILRSTAQ